MAVSERELGEVLTEIKILIPVVSETNRRLSDFLENRSCAVHDERIKTNNDLAKAAMVAAEKEGGKAKRLAWKLFSILSGTFGFAFGWLLNKIMDCCK